MSVKPITPQEASVRFVDSLPDFVIEAFNELISEKIGSSSTCTILQDDIVDRIIKKAAEVGLELERQTIFNKNYLDVEKAYEAVGWHVRYDKPGYGESYEAFFKFSCKTMDD